MELGGIPAANPRSLNEETSAILIQFNINSGTFIYSPHSHSIGL